MVTFFFGRYGIRMHVQSGNSIFIPLRPPKQELKDIKLHESEHLYNLDDSLTCPIWISDN